ncbi:MAG: hypothetical protein PHY95_04925 [Candidatus ainarchaeum sp.]|nr:hypothetical protein [Candidatus ainarchaeum sp.]
MMVLLLASCSTLDTGSGARIDQLMGRDGTTTLNGGTTDQRVQTVGGRVMNPSGADASTFGGRVYVV